MKHLLHRILRGDGGGVVEITHQFMPGKSGQEVLEDLLHCQELGRVWKIQLMPTFSISSPGHQCQGEVLAEPGSLNLTGSSDVPVSLAPVMWISSVFGRPGTCSSPHRGLCHTVNQRVEVQGWGGGSGGKGPAVQV